MEDETYAPDLKPSGLPDFEFSEEDQAKMISDRIAEVEVDLADPASSVECQAVRKEELDILTNGRTQRRPELNGTRRKHPNDEQVFLIDEGRRRRVDNWGTYDHLFRSRGGIINDRNVFEITPGLTLTERNRFCFRHPNVFVRDYPRPTAPYCEIRFVVSPAAMDKYHFNWTSVRQEGNNCGGHAGGFNGTCNYIGDRDFR